MTVTYNHCLFQYAYPSLSRSKNLHIHNAYISEKCLLVIGQFRVRMTVITVTIIQKDIYRVVEVTLIYRR